MASGAKFSGFPFHWGRLSLPRPRLCRDQAGGSGATTLGSAKNLTHGLK